MGLFTPIFKAIDNNAAAKAAFAGEFDKAFALYARGADINYTRWVDGKDGAEGGVGNIGYAAILRGDTATLEKALDLGLNPNLHSGYRNPLVIFAITNKQEDAAKLLISRGADVDQFRFQDFLSPLALARIYDMPDVVKMIEAKLSPTQLHASRAADLPQGPKANTLTP